MLYKNTFRSIIFLAIFHTTTFCMETQEDIYLKITAAITHNDFDTVTKYMESYSDINYITNYGYSITHYGFTNSIEMIHLILKYKPDINIKSSLGWTSLRCAINNFCEGLRSLQNVALLLEAGANLDTQDSQGLTAFDLAIRNGNPMVQQLFLDFLHKKAQRLEQELEEKSWTEEQLLFRHHSFEKLFANSNFIQKINLQTHDSEDTFANSWTPEHKALWPLVQNNGISLKRR